MCIHGLCLQRYLVDHARYHWAHHEWQLCRQCRVSDHLVGGCLGEHVCMPAGRQNETALAEANAALRRMDQVAELFGTLAFGWCITHHGNLVVLPAITGIALIALPFEIWAIRRVGMPPHCTFRVCVWNAIRIAKSQGLVQFMVIRLLSATT